MGRGRPPGFGGATGGLLLLGVLVLACVKSTLSGVPTSVPVEPAIKNSETANGDACFYAHLSCDECTKDPRCGWCSAGQEEGKCVQGSASGLEWDCDKWHYGPETCGTADKGVIPDSQKLRRAEVLVVTTTTTPKPNQTNATNVSATSKRKPSPQMQENDDEATDRAMAAMDPKPCTACGVIKAIAEDEVQRHFEDLPKPRLRGDDKDSGKKKKNDCIRYSRNDTKRGQTCDQMCSADPRCKSYVQVTNRDGPGAKCSLYAAYGCDTPDEDEAARLARERAAAARAAAAARLSSDGDAGAGETQADEERSAENAMKADLIRKEEEKLIANNMRKERRAARVPEDSYPFPDHLIAHAGERTLYPKSKINVINDEWLKQHPE